MKKTTPMATRNPKDLEDVRQLPLLPEEGDSERAGRTGAEPEKTSVQSLEFSTRGVSLERGKRDVEAGILAETRRRILELALLLEKGEANVEVVKRTEESLKKLVAEIEKGKGKDEQFNYPLLESVSRIVFEDLPLVFGTDAHVESALKVLQRVFRQRYNAVIVADGNNRAIGLVPSAVLINSDPESVLAKVPTVTKDFAVTLETKPAVVTAIMDRLGVNVLPVVDSNGLVIGVFTSRDHVKGTAALYSKKLKTEFETQAALGDIRGSLTAEGTSES